MELQFTKMHGCGNDFVVIDNRNQKLELHKDEIKLICDRHYGIGCDQLVVINRNNKKQKKQINRSKPGQDNPISHHF